jgi:CheY-like chemotaxis protein
MLLNNRILLVEDSDSDRFLFSRYLHQLGYECDCFENGKELIDKLATYPSSLVLLDIELPVMNGIETAIHVRKHYNNAERRFILIGLTSHNDPDVLEEIAASGFDNCLHKPLRKKELEVKLKQYITSSMSNNPDKSGQESNHMINNRLYSLEMFEADDPEFLESIVGMFVSSTPGAIEAMKNAFALQDWEQLRMHAHKLKPHFNYFMISEAALALQEVEEDARHIKEIEKIPALLQTIEHIGKLAVEQMKADYPSIQ